MSGPQANGVVPIAPAEQVNPAPKRKNDRALWPSSKTEPISALSAGRSQNVTASTTGQAATSNTTQDLTQNSSTVPSQSRQQGFQPAQNGARNEQSAHLNEPTAILALLPMTGTFERKQIHIPFSPDTLRIGRQTNAKTIPTASNGYFDSKVLSRQHAEVWADRGGKIWIRDVKSSNGTFVNGVRLSQENRESEPHELREQDILELGIDIVSEDQKSIVHHKVTAKVELAGIYSSAPAFLDMIHVDPHTGQHYPGESMGQTPSPMRGRNNHGTLTNNGRFNGTPNLTGGNPNMMGPQRQMNLWMAPITVEQVMRKLTVSL